VVNKPANVRAALQRVVELRTMATGTVAFPCVPALCDVYLDKLCTLWRTLGRPFDAPAKRALRDSLEAALQQGFAQSPHTLLVVTYQAHPAPAGTLGYSILLQERELADYYAAWRAGAAMGAMFGQQADAKVLAVAAALPAGAKVLDVGAGEGRNASALAARGLSVDALEPVASFCTSMREQGLHVLEGELREVALADDHYRLIVVSEVTSHLRSEAELRALFEQLGAALAPAGQLLLNAFVSKGSLDAAMRQATQAALSSAFTVDELARASAGLTLRSDEPAYGFERAHTPPEAWPPTPWFESWALGRNAFDLPPEQCPISLRWRLYEKPPAHP
jgi:2-polyprenyl-3-methyl-5-hydroxy-6-metoxy-1,4-benzoquinol methylase